MFLKSQIQNELKEALKAQKALELSTLRLLASAIQNKEIEKRFKLSKSLQNESELAKAAELSDEEIIDLIFSEIKKRKDAIEMFQKGGKEEMARKEEEEITILSKYLPKQLSEEEIESLVKNAILKTGAKDMKSMGLVMKELAPEIKGKADGGLVSAIIKKNLNP